MKNLALHWKIMIGMVLGVLWALISGYAGWNEFTIDWIDPFGVIFINCLKFIAIPLVLCTAYINVVIRKMEDLVSYGLNQFLEVFKECNIRFPNK